MDADTTKKVSDLLSIMEDMSSEIDIKKELSRFTLEIQSIKESLQELTDRFDQFEKTYLAKREDVKNIQTTGNMNKMSARASTLMVTNRRGPDKRCILASLALTLEQSQKDLCNDNNHHQLHKGHSGGVAQAEELETLQVGVEADGLGDVAGPAAGDQVNDVEQLKAIHGTYQNADHHKRQQQGGGDVPE